MQIKWRVAVVCLAVLVLAVLVGAVQAQGVQPGERVPQRVQQQAATFAVNMATKQEAYNRAHGRYWQGLRLRRDAVVDGERPTDEYATWSAMAADVVPDERDADIIVNIYESPEGHGYEIVTEYRDNRGRVWRHVDQVGPERWRAHDWTVLEVEQ